MSSKPRDLMKFPFRPEVNLEEYILMILGLYYLLSDPKGELWTFTHRLFRENPPSEDIELASRLLFYHWLMIGRAFTRRLLERRKGKREDVIKIWGKGTKSKILVKWLEDFSQHVAKSLIKERDRMLNDLKEIQKREIGI